MVKLKPLSPWLICKGKITQDEPVLVFFTYAGAGASVYYDWAKTIQGVTPVIVQLPGREHRLTEPLLTDVSSVAKETVDQLRTHLGSHPDVVFFGHSLGALNAYEVARIALSEKHKTPFNLKHLVVSGRGAPDGEDREGSIYSLPSDEFWQEVKDMGGMSETLMAAPELIALIEPILRADLQMNYQYEYAEAPPLPVPITVLSGNQDKHYTQSDLELWRSHTQDDSTFHAYEGGHFFINDHKKDIIRLLEAISAK